MLALLGTLVAFAHAPVEPLPKPHVEESWMPQQGATGAESPTAQASEPVGDGIFAREVAANTWVVTELTPWPANQLVAKFDDGSVLIVDTPSTAAATGKLVDWIKTTLSPSRIVAVNTHFHLESMAGNEALLAAGVRIYCSERTAELIDWIGAKRLGQAKRSLRGTPSDGALKDLRLKTPVYRFDNDDPFEITMGTEKAIVGYPGRAHTEDNHVVWLPDRGVLFAGHVVSGGEDLGNTQDAYLKKYAATVEALREYPAQIVIPGQGDRLDAALIDHTIELAGKAD